ncbi:MAG: Glutamyl-tRNA(Gln) amidotransferase subunit C [Alphaproteobacteria bacterium MarineAlpha2_Bin1]|nr:MAG: Glutamyl-tRNA(Gln) amidotransferase subunit C [Alphaproteobacteria bacterium MarineAlpha2_Bin1]|tara:strand:+ start:192 stop:479 length:288 start_codon:yes stop_codon:yes gene_type:complete
MTIERKTVEKISSLAKIKLKDKETSELTNDLSQIMEWIDQLNQIDTKNTPPLTGVIQTNLYQREDLISEDKKLEEILKNSPETTESFFVVPRVVD